MKSIQIGLEAWVLQDGNYYDFRAGESYEFAIEFYPKQIQAIEKTLKEFHHISNNTYKVTGEIIYLKEKVCVVDFGPVIAFTKRSIPQGSKVGQFITGNIVIEIDSFEYFENLSRLDGIPPLIYTWRIDQILKKPVDQPFIEAIITSETNGGDEDFDWYLLTCDKLDIKPKFRSTSAIYP